MPYYTVPFRSVCNLLPSTSHPLPPLTYTLITSLHFNLKPVPLLPSFTPPSPLLPFSSHPSSLFLPLHTFIFTLPLYSFLFIPSFQGEQTWLRINENHTRNNRVEEYKRIHNGRLPPDPLYVTILKTVAPCFFSPKSQGIKYAVGTAMESGIIDTDKKWYGTDRYNDLKYHSVAVYFLKCSVKNSLSTNRKTVWIEMDLDPMRFQIVGSLLVASDRVGR